MPRKVGRPKKQKTAQKRRRFTRARKFGRRVSRSRFGRKIAKHKKSLMTTVLGLVPALQSVQLLSENQVNAETTTSGKLKAIANGVFGSIFNFNPFQDVAKAHFNPQIEGAFNKWSVTNVGLIVGGMIGKHFGLKHASKIRNVGASAIVPSIIFGILGRGNQVASSVFDNPLATQSAPLTTTTTSHLLESPKL